MENRNFLLFITISIAILFMWSEFYTRPVLEAEQERLEAEAARDAELGLDTPQPSATSSLPGSVTAAGPGTGDRPLLDDDGSTQLRSRAEALSDARIAFEGEGMIGSISLRAPALMM